MAPRIVFASTPVNPLLQIVYLVVGTILLIGAVVMGAVILAFVLGFALILGLVLWVRVWWLRRKFMRSGHPKTDDHLHDGEPPADGGVEITGVEYRVIRETRRDKD